MICPFCKNVIPDESIFCGECGMKIPSEQNTQVLSDVSNSGFNYTQNSQSAQTDPNVYANSAQFSESGTSYSGEYHTTPGSYQYTDTSSISAKSATSSSDGFAIASLILGIESIVCCCVPLVVPSIIGLVLGIMGLKAEQRRGLAIAGIILNAVGIIISCILLLYTLGVMGTIAQDPSALPPDAYEIFDEFNGLF